MRASTILPVVSACAIALLSGCASNITRSEDGLLTARHKIGTNTGVEITATGNAADIVAGNLSQVPGAPADWNADGKIDPVRPVGSRVFGTMGTTSGTSTLHIVVGENQTKGLGLVLTAYISRVLAGAWEAVEIGKQGVQSTSIFEGTKAAKIAADKEVALRALDLEHMPPLP